jgi:hypothetical protein
MDEKEHGENDQDIADVMAEERSRGSRRRPIDPRTRRKIEKTRQDLVRAFHDGDERKYFKILRDAGMKDGSPEFVRAAELFRAAWGRG